MGGHVYKTPSGLKLPSVTTITGILDKSGPLTYWAANCACDYIIQELDGQKVISTTDLFPVIETARKNFRKVSYQALDVGSAVHAAIEEYLKSGREPQAVDDQVFAGFMAFIEWESQYDLKAIETEHTLYNEKEGYAGTCDLIAWLDGKKFLIDFKTSKQPRNNKPYEEWGYQTAAYRTCYPDIEGNGILRLDKETGYPDWYDMSGSYEHDLETFLSLRDAYYLHKKKMKWEVANGT